MTTIGKVMYWKGSRIDIQTKCNNRKEADYMFKLWAFMPPPILDFMYNKNLPKKKWDFYKWDAKWQQGMMKQSNFRVTDINGNHTPSPKQS